MVKTAKEFYDEHDSDDTVVIMRDYAKLHVKEALRIASEKATVIRDKEFHTISHVNKKSILNSYPIENIK